MKKVKMGTFFVLVITMMHIHFSYAASTIETILGINGWGNVNQFDGGFFARLLGGLLGVAFAVLAIMIFVIAAKYMMAAADEKADLKQALVKYIFGALIILFAIAAVNFIFNATKEKVGNSANTNSETGNSRVENSLYQ